MKFELGQTIWFMKNNKCEHGEIVARCLVENSEGYKDFTFGKDRNKYMTMNFQVDECDAFLSKEELINSL